MNVNVVGAGGHAKVVVATLRACGHDVTGLYDDAPEKQGMELLGVPVVGEVSDVVAAGLPVLIAVGNNPQRARIAQRLTRRGVTWVSALHPRALVEDSASVGQGVLVTAGAVVQPDTRLGPHAIINTGASVDHDCELGAFVHVAPGARLAGGVTLGEGALVGLGAVVLPGVTIGAWATVGAGAVVIEDVPPGVTVVGVPAQTHSSVGLPR